MNIIRRPTAPATFSTWDPFRAMREMMHPDPSDEATAGGDALHVNFNPDFEIKETKEGYQFRADLPGLKEKDIEVSLTGNRLNVSGHREADKREQHDRYYVYERSYGAFSRAFTLPDGVDTSKVIAELKDGVLTLLVPRRPEVQPQKVAVKSVP